MDMSLMLLEQVALSNSHWSVFSVYEKLFETSDIMSEVSELCVGHFHVLPDIIMLTIIKTNLVVINSHMIILEPAYFH